MVRCHSIQVTQFTAASAPCWCPAHIRVTPIFTSCLGITRRRILVGHPAAKHWTCSNTTLISITRRTRYMSFRSARSNHRRPRLLQRPPAHLRQVRPPPGPPVVRLRQLQARAHRRAKVNSHPASSRVNRVVSSSNKVRWMPAVEASARITDRRLHRDTCTRIIILTWASGIPY